MKKYYLKADSKAKMAVELGSYKFESDDINWDNYDDEIETLMNNFKIKNKELYEKTDYLIMNTSYVKRLLSPEWRHHHKKYLDVENIIGVDARNDGGYNGDARDPPSYYKRGTDAKNILDEFLPKTSGCILYDCRQTDIRQAIDEIFNLKFCGGLYESALMDVKWYPLGNGIVAIIEIDTESG